MKSRTHARDVASGYAGFARKAIVTRKSAKESNEVFSVLDNLSQLFYSKFMYERTIARNYASCP